ncbi:galactitol-1-phosphate 5-dehydrogenase [Actinomycetaceae bacterium L2_0104]
MQTMKSVAVTGKQQLSQFTTPLPDLAPDEALVRVAYTGICGSDVPRYFDGAVHGFPQILGHEFSGIVAATGSAATRVPIGTRVAVAPLVPCHSCERCRAGLLAQCPNYSFIGSRRPGAMAEYVVAPEQNLVPVPDSLSLKSAALIEPLTVAIHGLNQAPFPRGGSVAILGGGVIGLMALLAALDRGASSVTVVDIALWNLEMARRLGAHHTINSLEGDLAAEFAAIGKPELVIETAGAAPTRRQALEVAARGGQVVYIGTPSADLVLDPHTFELILRGELTIHGSWMSYSAPFPGTEWTDAARILSQVPFDPEMLVTHEFSLDEVATGMDAMRRSGDRRLKVMFRVAGEVTEL